ncbi:MAG TPA: hypothetical protein VJS39_00435, partial [Gemmatimonadaceae bacterium]|nr:hypothetical protein [Gemmatimonadaceae bacterium]
MKSLERAAALLQEATSIDNLEPILKELGFPAPLLPLDDAAVSALGLSSHVRNASVTQGNGALRALVIEIKLACDLRETLAGVATALSRNASQFLWIVVAVRASSGELAIVCWRSSGNRARIASLLCKTNHVLPSDAETLCMLTAVTGESDLLTHARWLDVLGREAITGRFFRALERTVIELGASLTGRVVAAERRELALLYTSRLIFLSFLESRGWLNADFCFLANTFESSLSNGGNYQKRILEPLFFGTLNTRIRARSQRARDFGRIPFL